jgi:hypothetical protein
LARQAEAATLVLRSKPKPRPDSKLAPLFDRQIEICLPLKLERGNAADVHFCTLGKSKTLPPLVDLRLGALQALATGFVFVGRLDDPEVNRIARRARIATLAKSKGRSRGVVGN